MGVLARGDEGLNATRAELQGMGVRVAAIRTDVAHADEVRRAADRVEKELGPIDVWVNNAMVTVFSPVAMLTAEEFARVTDVTYLGAVHGTMAALARMQKRDRGVIVQVGSALSERSIPLQSAYCGAKHAIRGFTDALRSELLHDGSHVRLTIVQLPALNTPQFRWSHNHMPRRPRPISPIFQPEIAADAIVWASRHPHREVKVGGPTAATMVAQKIVPGLLDRYLAFGGYDAQQTDAAEGPGSRDNLFDPVPLDLGAHGPFDERSHSHSLQWWLSKHRGLVAAGAAGLALAAGWRATVRAS